MLFRSTAVLCVNDFMAVGVLRELRDQGLEVPQDVSVTGFDNIELAEYLNPALTTANIPRKQIGRIIFDTLTPSPDHIGKDQEVLIDPQLVVRESTAKAKG